MVELRELASVTQDRDGEPVCHTLFDPHEDLLWTASRVGSLHSFTFPTLDRYSVIGAHSSFVVGLLGAAEGILSVSSEHVRMHKRDGNPMLSFRDDDAFGITSCDWDTPGAGRVLLGFLTGRISVLDLSTERVASSVLVGQDIAVMRSSERLVACGGLGGGIFLTDIRTMRTQLTIDAHPGIVSSLDLMDDMLVSSHPREPFIKVFDIRRQAHPVSFIPFDDGASSLRFRPTTTRNVLATSSSGAIALANFKPRGNNIGSRARRKAKGRDDYQLECKSGKMLAADISSSGDLFAFGDSGGHIHVWGTSENALGNPQHLSTELPDIEEAMADLHVHEQESFSDVFLPPSTDVPFSVGGSPRIRESAWLEQMVTSDFHGNVQIPYWRKGPSDGSAT